MGSESYKREQKHPFHAKNENNLDFIKNMLWHKIEF